MILYYTLKPKKKYKYVGGRNLMEAIRINGFSVNTGNDPNYVSNLNTDGQVKIDMGGIIALQSDIEKTFSIKNELISIVDSCLNQIPKNNYQISCGMFVRGEFVTHTKSIYNEHSPALEIMGITSELLYSIASKIAIEQNQETLIVKDYRLNKIFLLRFFDE
jgi:hypothetical protein